MRVILVCAVLCVLVCGVIAKEQQQQTTNTNENNKAVTDTTSAATTSTDANNKAEADQKAACYHMVDEQRLNNPLCAGFGPSNGADSLANADAAIKPLDDWIKDAKNRVGGGAAAMFNTAKATVKPLVRSLKLKQKRALREIRNTNQKIIDHVNEKATDHVYQLLKATAAKQKWNDSLQRKKDKLAELNQSQKEAKLLKEQITRHMSRQLKQMKTLKQKTKKALGGANNAANIVASGAATGSTKVKKLAASAEKLGSKLQQVLKKLKDARDKALGNNNKLGVKKVDKAIKKVLTKVQA